MGAQIVASERLGTGGVLRQSGEIDIVAGEINTRVGSDFMEDAG